MPGEYHWQGSQTRYRSQRVRHDWRDLARIYSPESVMPSNHRILYHPFILFPSIFPSLGVFSRVGSLHHVAQYGSFIFSISPPNEYSGLVSFWIDWFHLFAVQGILESSPTPQTKSISSSALSFLYSPTLTSIHDYWKNHSFDYMDLCQQIMSLLFNMLSRS